MAQPIPNLIIKETDANGLPLAGGKLYSYAAGTTTPQETFTDATGGTPNTNPVILDANGEASVWIDQRGYKFVLADASDNIQWTKDGIFLIENGSITTVKIEDGAVTPPKMDLSTLTSSDLPANVIGTVNIQPNAVTPDKIPDDSIPITKLDPAMDLTQFGHTCEIVFSRRGITGDGSVSGIPQYPWSTPALMSNPGILPAGVAHQPKWTRDGKFLAIPHATSPFITIYSRKGMTLTKLADPDVLPTAAGIDCSWSPDGQFLVVITNTISSSVVVYKRCGYTFEKIISPQLGLCTGAAWSPDGQYLSLTSQSSPYLFIYSFIHNKLISADSGTNVCYLMTTSAQTGQLGPGMSTDNGSSSGNWRIVSVPNSSQIIIECVNGTAPPSSGTMTFFDILPAAGTISASITVTSAQQISLGYGYYAWSSTSITPTSVPPVSGGVAPTQPKWSPDGQYISIVTSGSPYMATYQFTGSALNAVTAPTSIPTALCNADAWSPDGQYLAIGSSATPYIYVYQWNGSVFTLMTAPATLPAGAITGISWSSNGKYLGIAMTASPYVMVYSFDGTTLTALTQPTSLPTGAGSGIAWSPSNQFLCVTGQVTPYIFTYKTSGSIPTNSLLYVREVLDV